jgi:glycogen phosphorylase
LAEANSKKFAAEISCGILIGRLLDHDYFMVTADFAAYTNALGKMDKLWRDDRKAWTRKAIHNVARMGWFSSDRTIREYAHDIWGVTGN